MIGKGATLQDLGASIRDKGTGDSEIAETSMSAESWVASTEDSGEWVAFVGSTLQLLPANVFQPRHPIADDRSGET